MIGTAENYKKANGANATKLNAHFESEHQNDVILGNRKKMVISDDEDVDDVIENERIYSFANASVLNDLYLAPG